MSKPTEKCKPRHKPPYYYPCQVLSCRSIKDPNRVYHKFPLDPKRLNQWLKILGTKKSHIRTGSVVCSKHFRLKDYYPGTSRLISTAAPVLRLGKNPAKMKREPKNHILKTVKKSTLSEIPNKVKENKPIKLLGKPSQSAVKLDTLKSKLASRLKNKGAIIKKGKENLLSVDTLKNKLASRLENEGGIKKQDKENLLSVKSNKLIKEKKVEDKKSPLKSQPASVKRSQLVVKRTTFSQSKLRKNTIESYQNTTPGRKSTRSKVGTKDSSNSKILRSSKDQKSPNNHKCQSPKKKPTTVKEKNDSSIESKPVVEEVTSPKSLSENSRNSNQTVSNLENLNHSKDSEDSIIDTKTKSVSENSTTKIVLVESQTESSLENLNHCKVCDDPIIDTRTKPVSENPVNLISLTDTSVNDGQTECLEYSVHEICTNETNLKSTEIVTNYVENKSDESGNYSKTESLENPVSSIKTNSFPSIPLNESRTKVTNQPSSTNKRALEKCSRVEERSRRSIKRRKRLVSESESDEDCGIPKTQNKVKSKPRHKKQTAFITKELDQSHTSMTNTNSRNLSSIEKTIWEMQNKIQMLETKAILDEKKIETFKKALIAQRNTDLQMLMDEKENELLLRMDLLYLDYDPRKICRLCLQLVDKKEDLTPLFWPLKNQALLSLIKQATNVEVELEDGMPSSICGDCLEDIQRVDWLKRRTQKSNSLIKKFVTMKKGSSQSNSETPQTSDEVKLRFDENPHEEVIPEVKIEDVFSLENSPVSLFENIMIKEEPESDIEDHEVNRIYSKTKKPVKPKKCRRCSRTFKHPWTMMVHERYCSKRFQCSECNRCFLTTLLYRRHRQTMYSCYCARRLRYCSDCDVSFRWKWQLVFHVLRHNTHVCVCGDPIHSEEHFRHHLTVFHREHVS